ncbi:hypothetical protein Tcan_13722 [Toxocara canis]|uniref:Uncharacterized protein n=1 Tax=Toxocara canis TaxID=6265 RepID=A0A0B2UTG3_TOXCA|nr:hypothetical protein Tcan_13722 [Toxocara canis]
MQLLPPNESALSEGYGMRGSICLAPALALCESCDIFGKMVEPNNNNKAILLRRNGVAQSNNRLNQQHLLPDNVHRMSHSKRKRMQLLPPNESALSEGYGMRGSICLAPALALCESCDIFGKMVEPNNNNKAILLRRNGVAQSNNRLNQQHLLPDNLISTNSSEDPENVAEHRSDDVDQNNEEDERERQFNLTINLSDDSAVVYHDTPLSDAAPEEDEVDVEEVDDAEELPELQMTWDEIQECYADYPMLESNVFEDEEMLPLDQVVYYEGGEEMEGEGQEPYEWEEEVLFCGSDDNYRYAEDIKQKGRHTRNLMVAIIMDDTGVFT